jgi:hypothetical protein
VAEEFGLNNAQTLDAYRSHTLPPGVTPDSVARLLSAS